MIPIFATSTQANLLIYVGGGGFVLLGAFYFGRLVTFFFPKNPLIRKGKEYNSELTPKQREFPEFLEYASSTNPGGIVAPSPPTAVLDNIFGQRKSKF